MLNTENSQRVLPSPEEIYSDSSSESMRGKSAHETKENSSGLLSRIRAVRASADEDSQVELEYHYKQFLTAIIIHTVHSIAGPASLPLLFWIYGKYICTNIGFGNTRFYYMEVLIWIWTVLIIVFWSVNTKDFELWQCLIFTSICTQLLRMTLISLKYGYYTVDRWTLMGMEMIPTKKLAGEFLIHSWLRLPVEVIDHELIQAFNRLNKSPCDLCMTFEMPLADSCKECMAKYQAEYGIEILHKDPEPHKGNECYSTMILARLMIEFVVEHTKIRLEVIMLKLFAITYSLLPFLVRYLKQDKMQGTDPLFIIFAIWSSFMNFRLSYGFILFIYIGVFDFRRKKMLMDQCSTMISDKEIIGTFSYEHNTPLLNMQDPRTVESWYSMRQAFLDFGRKYTYRIFLYAGLVLALCFVILVFVLLQLFSPQQNIKSSSFTSIFFLTIICLGFIIHMIISGVELNRAFAVHRDLLLNIMELLVKESDYKDDDCTQSSLKILELEIKKLEQDELLRPIKIMGVRTDSVFFAKMLAVFFSGVLAIGQLYLKSNSNNVI
ncbi:unnamed protein product [Blepharisma stoltei]|uniref:Gustatory receptor n=1 Tax=Blepharisma stoltei TaxID=1481888 RepID=A0AAU9JFL3_9CILI|nr:unnamed protein product [Blepharisma stoltei]